MKNLTTAGFLTALLAIAPSASSTARLFAAQDAGKPAREVTLTTDDKMKYSLATIEARPGERIKVVLKNMGTMPKTVMAHNFVVLKKGTDPAAFLRAGLTSRETDFIAPAEKDKVLAATPMSGPGETVEITFTAPPAGSYQYLCTFPGHFNTGMKGTLVVK